MRMVLERGVLDLMMAMRQRPLKSGRTEVVAFALWLMIFGRMNFSHATKYVSRLGTRVVGEQTAKGLSRQGAGLANSSSARAYALM